MLESHVVSIYTSTAFGHARTFQSLVLQCCPYLFRLAFDSCFNALRFSCMYLDCPSYTTIALL